MTAPTDPRLWTIDETIARAMSSFRAKRGERTIWAGARRRAVRTAGERILHLPNGHHVRVSVDDSGVATQIEDNDSLHAIVRPDLHRIRGRLPAPDLVASSAAAPRTISVVAHPHV